MIAGLKPYPRMKESGVPWLGEVPEHWTTASVKRSYAIQLGKMLQNRPEGPADTEVPYLKAQHVQWFSVRTSPVPKMWASPRDMKQFGIATGDLLVCEGGEGGRAGIVHAAPPGLIIQNALHRVRPHGRCLNEFLQYVMSAVSATGWFDAINNKATIAHFTREKFGALGMPVAPLPEQTAIVRFLDYMDRRIRRYIRAKQKLIKLLEEQKQAIIHRAVTRGLDPNVRLKPSGVGWLGDVPEHWEVRRVKSLSLVKRGASPRPISDSRYFDDSGDYAWVRIADVTASSRFLESTSQRLSRLGESLSVRLEPGALFLSIAGSVGKPIITRIRCCIHDGFVWFPQLRGNADFLYRVFSCGAPFARLGKLGTQLNLNTDTVGAICLGWPPAREQARIVEYLDEATASFEQAITSARREIELIREFRTRLIADVVTGKLDVREVAARLPDESSEPEAIDEEPCDGGQEREEDDAPAEEADVG